MSGDQPPVGPGPSDEVPQTPANDGDPGTAGGHPASGMPSPTPPGPTGPPPGEVAASGLSAPSARDTAAVNPYGDPTRYAEPEKPGLQWILVVVGIPVGFVAWVLGSFLLLAVTGTLAGTSGSNVLALVLLVVLLAASVGLIVWPRTRRLAQGFVLGAAIGLVVAGGLCIPLVSSF